METSWLIRVTSYPYVYDAIEEHDGTSNMDWAAKEWTGSFNGDTSYKTFNWTIKK
jgi:hypothetical protein